MEFDLFPSLASIASRRIVISLWYAESVLVREGVITLKYDVTKIAEDHVASNIRNFVPNFLQPKMQPLIRPIGEQIKFWILSNRQYSWAKIDICKEMYWSPFGLIDYTKTAENILSHYEKVTNFKSNIQSFVLATSNGVGPQICRIWPLIRSYFLNPNTPNTSEIESEMTSWIDLLIERFPSSPSVHLHSIDMQFFVQRFVAALDCCNMELIRFYFQCLNPSRQLKYIREFTAKYSRLGFSYEEKAPVLLFFLQYMSTSQKEEFVRLYPREMLFSFLEWPLQCYFLKVAEKVVPTIPAEDFYVIFKSIVQRMLRFEHEAKLYLIMLKSVWAISPVDTKQYCFHRRIYRILVNLFYPFSYEEALTVLLKTNNAQEKVKDTFFYDMDAMFEFMLEDNKHKAFRAILEKFVPDEDRERFETEYVRFTQEYLKDYYAD